MKVDYEVGLRVNKASGAKGSEAEAADVETYKFGDKRIVRVAEQTLQWARADPRFQEEALSQATELAIHQDMSRLTMSFGKVLEHFLDGVLNEFPYEGYRLSKSEKDEYFELAFEEQAVSMHRLLLRRTLAGKKVSMGTLTEIVYPRSRENDFNKKRRVVRDTYRTPMEEMWLWEVEEVERENRDGTRQIARYEISAGPALLAFSALVFVPLRTDILKQLIERL